MKPDKMYLLLALLAVIVCLLVVSVITGFRSGWDDPEETTQATELTEPAETTVVTEPPHNWQTGYISSMNPEVPCCDETGTVLGTLVRGFQVEYEITEDGSISLLFGDDIVYLGEGGTIVTDPAEVIPEQNLFVRTVANLRDEKGGLLETLPEKGTAVLVTGYDYLLPDGSAHMYRIRIQNTETEGYMMPWYLTDTQEEAVSNYDNGHYETHAARGNRYGGGSADNLDYFPRDKDAIEDNEMPEECRALYIISSRVDEVDEYLKIAESSGINAFVVDILDGGSVGYAADVMKKYSPTGAAAAHNTVEVYQAAIRKLKDAGYYVIGRITTFNDTCYVKDHPEHAIANTEGKPLRLSKAYWPSPYNRDVWQYKVELAVEAVELMGFNEIQFDYVRFPDKTRSYEKNGTIDFRNVYGETKAQAIQRFLMYATDILHDHGAYVSADVYGESAYTYVTAYGQYWAAVSNVVDVISGMPYPDHFGASGSWRPWEHPYETLYSWGEQVMQRQAETATPAVVRTWIQAYNALHAPYNRYGPEEVAAQIRGLRDSGCTGGYMTWNGSSSLDKYQSLISAFDPPGE